MKSFTITIGTTPVNIYELLTGVSSYSGASVTGSRVLSKKIRSLVKELVITADDANSDFVYIGEDSRVATTDYAVKLTAGFEHRCVSDVPDIMLTQWLRGGLASQKVHLKIIWG